jgi:RNA polymerase sigma-70 factor (ECF subfamily)
MPLSASALAALIDQHAAALRLWVRSQAADADNAVQEAFCRLAAEDPPPDSAVAWLYRVSRNLALKQRLSDQRRLQREQTHAAVAATRGSAADPLELAEMLAAVERLDDELRQVLVARIWGQLSLEEIGRLCGLSTATAHRRYQTALETLRTMLDEGAKSRGRTTHS